MNSIPDGIIFSPIPRNRKYINKQYQKIYFSTPIFLNFFLKIRKSNIFSEKIDLDIFIIFKIKK